MSFAIIAFLFRSKTWSWVGLGSVLHLVKALLPRMTFLPFLCVVYAGILSTAHAERDRLPSDFPLHPATYGGAGGGTHQSERSQLRHLPVVMVAGVGRTHRDWTGAHPGNATRAEGVSVYDHFIEAGFHPIELWMIDFAREGEQMSSIEEATDDLKFFITAVMRYTGANRVQILAHDTGGLLARLTLIKYHIAHWIGREVYIGTPFHGVSNPDPPERTLHGDPNAWCVTPGSPLLREIAMHGETLATTDPANGRPYRLQTMTLRNGSRGSDARFAFHPDSPALCGAINIAMPALDQNGLRCAAASAAVFIPFLREETRPYDPRHDRDGDGFMGSAAGGPDLNDEEATIYPGAPERLGDGIDQDCNGHDLDLHMGRDGEIPIPRQMPTDHGIEAETYDKKVGP